MEEYIRKYPLFSLCGLNCGLCPRYQTDGASKCPGCGGSDFHLKHPTCAVGMTFVFDNTAAMNAYLEHPLHKEAQRKVLRPLVKKVVVYDIRETALQ